MKILNHLNHRNHFNPSSGRGGFSLIELVFAMMFLTIVILGVVSLQTSNLGMLNGQKNQIQAHFLATQGAQIVKALGYAASDTVFLACSNPQACYKQIDLDSGTYKFMDSVPEIKIGNQGFNRKIKISTSNGKLDKGYLIKSIVEWEDSTGAHYENDPVTSEALNSQVETDLIIIKP